MPTGTEWLDVARVDAITQGLVDSRELPADLLFLNRTPEVPATNGEILMRQIERVHISDVISYDSKAVVYTRGKATLELNTLPKIKHGVTLTEGELEQLYEIRADGRIPGGGMWEDVEGRTIDAIVTGIRQRQEQLIVAMHCDGVSYDRLGIKIVGTWGMPADLKPTVAVGWDDAANARPVDNILALQLLARVRYGTEFNRLTMSTPAFQLMIATAEFQAKARTYLAPNVSYVNLPMADLPAQKNLAMQILGVGSIEFYDARYWSQGIDDGLYVSTPYLPTNKVILTNSGNDNRREVQDFASGIVVETMVSGIVPTSMNGRFAAPRRGPVTYVTGNPDLNPPDVTYWGVMVGFPRKKVLQASACMTIATNVPQNIPVGEPFI